MTTIALIARREIVARLQQKGFRIGLIVTLVLIALGSLAPKVIGGDKTKSYDVGVTGVRAAEVSSAIEQTAAAQRVTVHVHPATADDARQKVHQGTWDAAVIDDTQIVAKKPDAQAVVIAQQAHRSLTTLSRLKSAGLRRDQVSGAFTVAPLTVSSTASAENTQRQAIATITVVVLFGQLIAFCTWIAMGVVEEKSSRVVELLLAAVRPLQLMVGKLMGIGLLAIVQVLLLAGTALAVSTAAGTLNLPGSAYAAVSVSLGWFVLGFAFFAVVSAALASLVSWQEEVSGVLTPVTALLLVSYLGSFGVAASPDSAAARIFSVIPPISSIAMPARIARGGVPISDLLIAVGLMLGLTAAILVMAARIYRAAILHTGSRLTLRKAWRGEAVADLA